MKRCENCKAKFEENATFCPICGALLQDEQSHKKMIISLVAVAVLAVLVAALIWGRLQAMEKYETAKQETSVQPTEQKNTENQTIPETVPARDTPAYETSATTDSDYGTLNHDIAGEYILPESDTQYISSRDVAYLTDRELRLARNEIFARHGRMFDDPELSAYFNATSWYYGTIPSSSFSDDSLSKVEKANIEVIKAEEARR